MVYTDMKYWLKQVDVNLYAKIEGLYSNIWIKYVVRACAQTVGRKQRRGCRKIGLRQSFFILYHTSTHTCLQCFLQLLTFDF